MNDTVIIHGMRDQAWKIKLAEAIRHEDGKDLQLIHELATLCANVYEDKEKYDKTWVDNKTRFPLSGWEEITFEKEELRIYEDGEGLGFVRHFMKWLHPLSKVNPQIIEIRCGFSKGNPIKQHNMKALAAHLFTALEPNN